MNMDELEKLEIPQGHCVTLFFPEEYGLEPSTIRGPVPQKGDVIYVRGDITVDNDAYDYELRNRKMKHRWLRRWKVADVYFSTTIMSRMSLDQLRTYEMRAEVIVKPVWFKMGYISRIRRWFRLRKRRKQVT